MPLIFGGPEANEQLQRDTGKRFDLAAVDPFQPIDLPELDAADPICTSCGSRMDWADCWQCGGKGGRDGDDLMDEDPLWYCEDDWEECDICQGKGGFWECASLPHEEEAASV